MKACKDCNHVRQRAGTLGGALCTHPSNTPKEYDFWNGVVTGKCFPIQTARSAGDLCGLVGRWFEPKKGD